MCKLVRTWPEFLKFAKNPVTSLAVTLPEKQGKSQKEKNKEIQSSKERGSSDKIRHFPTFSSCVIERHKLHRVLQGAAQSRARFYFIFVVLQTPLFMQHNESFLHQNLHPMNLVTRIAATSNRKSLATALATQKDHCDSETPCNT